MRKRPQLSFEIDEELKKLVKMQAVLRYMSISKWMHRAIQNQLIMDKILPKE